MPSRNAGPGGVNWQINGWISRVWLVNVEMVVTVNCWPAFVTPGGTGVVMVLVVPTRLVDATWTISNPQVHAAGTIKKSPDGKLSTKLVVVTLVHKVPASPFVHGPI